MTSHRSDRTVIEKDDFSNKGDNVTHYKIVNKLVAYTDEGVELLEVHVQSLNKPNDTGAILDKRTLRKSIITNFDDNFDDQLEILGFDKGQFSANKYETDYEIPDMKTGEWYSTKSLKTSNCKEQIDLA